MYDRFVDEVFDELAEEYDVVDALVRQQDQSDQPTLTPKPGQFYRIRSTDSLLKVAGIAYGLSPGQRRLAAAHRINDAVSNHRFRRPELTDNGLLPSGRISFSPRFACDTTSQSATTGRATAGGCYATIWIPPEYGLVHPLLGTAVALPPFGKGFEGALLELIDRSCTIEKDAALVSGPDTRKFVPNSRLPPYRWVCSINVIFTDQRGHLYMNGASGVLIGRHHVLTVAHAVQGPMCVVSTDGTTCEKWILPKIAGVIVTPAKNGIPDKHEPGITEAHPFGEYVVDVPEGRSTVIRVPRRWASWVNSELPRLNGLAPCARIAADCRFRPDARNDFALIRYKPSSFFGGSHIDGFFGQNKRLVGRGGKFVETAIGEPAGGLLNDQIVTAAGYPSDQRCELWEGNGFILRSEPLQFSYDADISIGNSGCPIWKHSSIVRRGETVGYQYHLVGIQSSFRPSERNLAVRVSGAWPTIERWILEDSRPRR